MGRTVKNKVSESNGQRRAQLFPWSVAHSTPESEQNMWRGPDGRAALSIMPRISHMQRIQKIAGLNIMRKKHGNGYPKLGLIQNDGVCVRIAFQTLVRK